MQIGVTFPQNEITADPSAVRDYVQSAEEFGYRHLIIYDRPWMAKHTPLPEAG